MIRIATAAAVFAGSLVSACGPGDGASGSDAIYAAAAVDTTVPAPDRLAALFADYEADRIEPQEIDTAAARAWVEQTLRSMSLKEKVGQLLIVDMSAGGFRDLLDDPADLVQEHAVGGFLVPRLMSPRDVYRRTARLQELARVPMFFAADYERGVGRFNNPLTELPSNMAVGATRDTVFAAAMGRLTSIESRAIGINLVFAPVVDVNNNPDNPIINIRSYGEDPTLVGRMAAAFVGEAQRYGTLTTLKHFPGHGDTAVDTHARMAVVEADRAALDSVELRPYQIVLERGILPAGVMSGHLWARGLDENARPATLSENALTGVLRNEFGFDGFIVTDDVKMGGLRGEYTPEERLVGPLLAGADIILAPSDPAEAISIILRAVDAGRLSGESVDASVRRVLRAKARAGLYREPATNEELLDYLLERPRGAALAQAVADQAVTVLRTHPVLPLARDSSTVVVQFTNYRGSESIEAAMNVFERRLEEDGTLLEGFRFDRDVLAGQRREVLTTAAEGKAVIVALYLRLIAGRGDAALLPGQTTLVRSLIQADVPVVLVTFGNPYAVSAFEGAAAHVVAYDQSLETARAVQHILAGTMLPAGNLPITVDPYPYGAGLKSLVP